jgi:hypothetical protein
MRGQRSLFADIIIDDKPVHTATDGTTRRNTKLVHRYYWYAKLQPKQLDYGYILTQLELEFDLSTVRLIVVLNDNHDLLKQIIATKPTARQLAGMYPYLVW